MNKYVFYAHAGSTNHGCEAIVRSTTAMIGSEVTLYSMNIESDLKYGIDSCIAEIREDKNKKTIRKSMKGLDAAIYTKLTGKIDRTIFYRKQELISSARKGEIWFSIGGDNYCYAGTDILAAENRLLKKKGVKTVLWGCSVSPELLENKETAKKLASFDLITARETLSYEALRRVNKNTVLVSDPAFSLKTEELSLPDYWKKGRMVGINASPLILRTQKDNTIILDAYRSLIQYILSNEENDIILIPHVITRHDDDREVLQLLLKEFESTNRVHLLGDYNCCQIKGFISRCRFFIGARTHATIAAYSSCVPTLVLGYSVKSKGIAKDLFGTYENYVLSGQNIIKPEELIEHYKWLVINEKPIAKHLSEILPEYIANAYKAVEALSKL